MPDRNIFGILTLIGIILIGVVWYAYTPKTPGRLEYTNTEYGFRVSLPTSWNGYSIIPNSWEGYVPGTNGDTVSEKGPLISIRHPEWITDAPRQDIPIMIFTTQQWNALQQEKFHIGAAPIGPRELGRNNSYVFALPARYNFAFPTGYEEVEHLLEQHSLQAF